ncbi:universal stress protein [Mesobacillus foraminis]|uniref:universal stress protein n=1 Tax=Mesobacillus foraminis TaxID=279826 RepID=UPI0039A164BA
MSQFNKVVVAYDNSGGCNKALEMAGLLKKLYPLMDLIVVHVYKEKLINVPVESKELAIPGPRIEAYTVDELSAPPLALEKNAAGKSTHAKLVNSAEQAIYNARTELEKNEVDARYKIIEGNPAESICDFAEAEQADLLILGPPGNTGLKQIFMGSTSQKIAENAPCSVLIAK